MIRTLRKLFGSPSHPPQPAAPEKPKHHRDISAEDLAYMRAQSEYPELLDHVVAMERERIGFFPAHNNRALEYPWLLKEMSEPPVPATVLDVGAGLNPIPFCLAELGCNVTTVDYHQTVRTLETREQWNEWGFLDYSILDSRIRSVHCRYEEFVPDSKFDAIYSASVIEHIPAEIRRQWAKCFAAQLNSGGSLYLTLDLKPNSRSLWHLSEDQLVEDLAIHGTQDDVCKELEAEGFTITYEKVFPSVKDSRIGTGLLAAQLL